MATLSSETPDRRVQDIVAAADQQRRARDARRLLIRLAPLAGGLAVLVAISVRLLRGSSTISLVVLGVLAVAVAAMVFWLSRRRPSTDEIALRVDTDAQLAGELRSAHWFSKTGSGDEWISYHLNRAADRAAQVSWRELYPRESGTPAWLMSGVCVVAVVALAVIVPQRQSLVAAGSTAETTTLPGLPPELQAKLDAMLAKMKAGTLQADEATLADLKNIAKLDPKLQKTIDELMKNKLGQDAQKLKDGKPVDPADKERPSNGGLPEDVRWALEDLAKRLANSNQDRQTNDKNPAASDQTGEKGMGSDQASTQQANSTEAQMQLVREASSDASASQMMMGGGGMGGQQSGQQGNNGAQKNAAEANVLAIAQALKKETVEANEDMLGKNVQKEDIRRKTEASKSGMGFTKVAPTATFDKSHATAPPPVPESRRPLLQNYFIRKQ